MKNTNNKNTGIEDLFVTEYFTVCDVFPCQYEAAGADQKKGEERLPFYERGKGRILNVIPQNENGPVRQIRFDGPTVAGEGYLIAAKILKYDAGKSGEAMNVMGNGYKNDQNGGLRPLEKAIELTYLTEDGRPFFSDRSDDYIEIMKRNIH